MIQSPKGLRLAIGIYGRRNVGKSSLLNVMTRQAVSIVSDTPGTTTDPVEKSMELLPIGPVCWIDTAGLDDIGALGNQRIEKSKTAMQRTDVALLVSDGTWREEDVQILNELQAFKIPVILVANKTENYTFEDSEVAHFATTQNLPIVPFSAHAKIGVQPLIDQIFKVAPETFWSQRAIVSDLIPSGALAMLVIPIDKEAPRGRLILPQVQTIRDLLDADRHIYIVTENQISQALANLKTPPALVVCDSQVFHSIKDTIPSKIPLTSFSVLFARLKGDLNTFISGARAIADLKPGDAVLIAEACTHHPVGEDIGRVKIPRALNRVVGGELCFTHVQGHDLPSNIADYKLIVHCGACTFNPKEVMTRIQFAENQHVPITNYGLVLAYCSGIFDRAILPLLSR